MRSARIIKRLRLLIPQLIRTGKVKAKRYISTFWFVAEALKKLFKKHYILVLIIANFWSENIKNKLIKKLEKVKS